MSDRLNDSRRPVLHLDSPAYGGDWSPEQWDQATWSRDIELMIEAGVTMITLGVFSWARLEPKEGGYELDWLADVIDRLHAAGIAVDLATGTASPPAWMAVDHPETLPVDFHGVRLGFGSRQQYCPSSPVYRERSRALAAQLAERFGRHPGVVMWHINNEYACHTHECFCDVCAGEFSAYLAARYTEVDALNAAWGTDFWAQRYTGFEQIRPPAAAPTLLSPAQVLDWRRFSNRQLLQCMTGEKAQIRERSALPITTNFMGAFPWLDYREWAQHLDVITDDSYPDPADPAAAADVAWAGDLMRGLAAGKPWLLMEQAPGAVQWRERNAAKRPGQLTQWSLARLAHGADGVLQFQWRQSVRGAESFHSGMVPHSEAASRVWQETKALGRELARLGPVIGQPTTADVAIVIDWESEWARGAAIGPVNDAEPFESARQWHRTLWESGVAVDVIGPDDAVETYRAVIVPALAIDRPRLAARLETAVGEGTRVVVAGPTGIVDDQLAAITGGYLGSLRDLLGVRVIDFAPAVGIEPMSARDASASRITRATIAPASHEWIGIEPAGPLALDVASDVRGGRWAEEVVVTAASESVPGAAVVGTFDGRGAGVDLRGMPAITRRRHGEGSAWYVATDLDAASRAVVAHSVMREADVRPVLEALPDGIEAHRRGDFLFLLNHSDEAVSVPGMAGTELLTDAECGQTLPLAPRGSAVVRLATA